MVIKVSVNIGWKKKDPRKLTYIDGGSSLHKILDDHFRGFPIDLGEKDIGVLMGIAACGNSGAKELLDAIYLYENIVVEAEW